MDYSELLASNGSGDAALAHVEAGRLPGATTLNVDSTANWPAKFIATSGTLTASGYIDPATKLEFKGHLVSGDIFIDSFEPGFTDTGNTQGQVVALRPSTGLVNELVELARVAHNDDGTLKTELLSALYPIGSIYTSTVLTNPNTLFGFGTWVAFGAGKVLVGKAPSGTFNTAGATGGEETHTLNTGEIPAHAHGVNDPGHGHTVNIGNFAIRKIVGSSDGNNGLWEGGGPSGVNGSGTGISIQNAGGDGAHNNLQPYVVVYMWNRTA